VATACTDTLLERELVSAGVSFVRIAPRIPEPDAPDEVRVEYYQTHFKIDTDDEY
jgi:hypothetical protein